MKIKHHAIAVFALIALLTGPSIAVTAASVFSETQSLGFGSFAMRNNNAAYFMTVGPTGSVTHSSQLLPISGAQNAVYSLTGFPVSTIFAVDVSPPSVILTGGTQTFTVDTFVITPSSPITNGAGVATLDMGATLHTSGSHTMYTDGSYTGSLTIQVNF